MQTTTTAKAIAVQERTTKPAVIATLKPVVEPAKETSDVTKDDYVIYSRDYIHSFQRFGVGEARIKFLKEFQTPCFLEHSAGSVGHVNDHVHIYAYATAEVTKGMNVHPHSCPLQ